MERHIQILRELADGRFHSGEKLANTTGISRATVWKAVKKLREKLGLKIDAVTGRGYRLAVPMEFLDSGEILTQLSNEVQRRLPRILVHDSVDSTNDWLMRHAGVLPSGTVCLAERQTAGKGRHGRTWVSPFGSNIYLSLLWRFTLPPSELSGLSLAVGARTAQSLEHAGVADIALKWPNDLLWNRRKLAGLLLEIVGEATGPSLVVIGLGLNMRLDEEQAKDIDQPWTDLTSILRTRRFNRNLLVARLLGALVDVLDTYRQTGLEPFLPLWNQYDLYRGEQVELRHGSERIVGIHQGVDREGSLRLAVDGETRTFRGGEVSLRGVG